MQEIRKITSSIIPLSKLGATFGKNLLETIKNKCSSIAHYSDYIPKQIKVDTQRAALPWEVDQQQVKKYREMQRIGIVCDDCKPQSLIDKFRSILERRRLRKCMEERYYRQQCQDIELELATTKKSYPFLHAAVKEYLPGAPMHNWQELNKRNRYDDLPCC